MAHSNFGSADWAAEGVRENLKWVNAVLTGGVSLAGSLVVTSISHFSASSDDPKRAALFNEVVAKHGLFVRGMVPRAVPISSEVGQLRFRMVWKDLTAWVAYGGALLTGAAIIPFSAATTGRSAVLVGIAGVLLYLNWRIGAQWAVALSELSVPKARTRYLRTLSQLSWTQLMRSFADSGISARAVLIVAWLVGLLSWIITSSGS